MTRYLLTLAMFLGLQACAGDDTGKGDDDDTVGDDDDAGDDDDDDDATSGDTVESGYEEYYLEPFALWPQADMTFQDGQLVNLVTDDGEIPGSVLVIISSEAWSVGDYYDYENYCFYQAEITDDTIPTFVADLGLIVGAAYTDAAPVTSCGYYTFPDGFDPAVVMQEGLGAGIGPRSADSEDYISQVANPDYEDQFLGSGFNLPFFEDPLWGPAFAVGGQIDGNREPIVGNDGYLVPITVQDMNAAEPSVPDGTYDLYAAGIQITN